MSRRTRPQAHLLLLVAAVQGLSLDVQPSDRQCDLEAAVDGYTAAVLEMAPVGSDVAANIDEIARQSEEAAQLGVDLLVAPEYAITTSDRLASRELFRQHAASLPPLNRDPAPCHDHSSVSSAIRQLSCIANNNSIYLVANLGEVEDCRPGTHNCSSDGFFLYNTNVIFDRRGRLIQRYRKRHLFGIELSVLDTPTPHLAAFCTDFNVVFGVFTCFDVLFRTPAVQLTQHGVRHFVFPTAWGDELPSLTALQMHSGWARGLQVTLLSANRRRLEVGGVGSGVFSGTGTLNYTCQTQHPNHNTLVIARVPGDSETDAHDTRTGEQQKFIPTRPWADDESSQQDDVYILQHYNISDYKTALLTGEDQVLCDEGLCCRLENLAPIKLNRTFTATHLISYRGRRNYTPFWSTHICAVVRCRDAGDPASCSFFPSPIDGTVVAATDDDSPVSLRLCGSFDQSETLTVFPSVLQRGLRLDHHWRYDAHSRCITVHELPHLHALQLYGRDFNTDGASVDEYRSQWTSAQQDIQIL